MIIPLYAPTRKNRVPVKNGCAIYSTPAGNAALSLSWLFTGIGQRAYLVCPLCGARRTALYVKGSVIGCRLHISPYKGIQNATKGGADRIGYSMEKVAEKRRIPFRLGESPLEYIAQDKRPKYMQKLTFADTMARLYVLEWLRVNNIDLRRQKKKPPYEITDNIGFIRAIEHGTREELAILEPYRCAMEYAQRRYRKIWL